MCVLCTILYQDLGNFVRAALEFCTETWISNKNFCCRTENNYEITLSSWPALKHTKPSSIRVQLLYLVKSASVFYRDFRDFLDV